MRSMTNIQIICKLPLDFDKANLIMKKFIFLFFLAFFTASCLQETEQGNSFVPYVVVNKSININLASYNDLLTPSGYVVIANLGYRGVIVYNMGNGGYIAFDLACPHLDGSGCTAPLDYSNFPELTNSCEDDGIYYDFQLGYSITYSKNKDGDQIDVSGTAYVLTQYKVIDNGNNQLIITNF